MTASLPASVKETITISGEAGECCCSSSNTVAYVMIGNGERQSRAAANALP
jgi:hypothetical protein